MLNSFRLPVSAYWQRILIPLQFSSGRLILYSTGFLHLSTGFGAVDWCKYRTFIFHLRSSSDYSPLVCFSTISTGIEHSIKLSWIGIHNGVVCMDSGCCNIRIVCSSPLYTVCVRGTYLPVVSPVIGVSPHYWNSIVYVDLQAKGTKKEISSSQQLCDECGAYRPFRTDCP